ncbi:MAG: aspartate aminotransferase family protein [Deltaproteobacteria bacterium]|nr:aspartate aminotransferase family protein [Deltaproteobacteria bacterium]
MNTQALIKKSSQFLFNNLKRLPIVFERGEGCWLYDLEGKKYLDLVAGIAVNVLGHAYPKMSEVIAEQSKKLIHTSNLYQVRYQVELAEKLASISFADKSFFCNSGAEANEAALKLARKYQKVNGHPERFKLLTFEGSFHGRTLAMINANASPKFRKGFEPDVPGFVYLPFGDLQVVQQLLEKDTEIAALLVEPIQGEGGINIPPSGYLEGLRKLCDQHGVLLMLDEVQTAIGRTGKMFAYEHTSIQPDVMTLAKGLAGGIPIGALLATDKVAAAFQPGDHASTFGGNPFATRVALCVLEGVQNELLKSVQDLGLYFLNALKDLQTKKDIIKEVRGLGLMLGIELKQTLPNVVQQAMQEGLLINCTHDTVLRFVPPLILKKEEIDWALGVLEKIL